MTGQSVYIKLRANKIHIVSTGQTFVYVQLLTEDDEFIMLLKIPFEDFSALTAASGEGITVEARVDERIDFSAET